MTKPTSVLVFLLLATKSIVSYADEVDVSTLVTDPVGDHIQAPNNAFDHKSSKEAGIETAENTNDASVDQLHSRNNNNNESTTNEDSERSMSLEESNITDDPELLTPSTEEAEDIDDTPLQTGSAASTKENNKRFWGHPEFQHPNNNNFQQVPNTVSKPKTKFETADGNVSTNATEDSKFSKGTATVSFVPKPHIHATNGPMHNPPEGFVVSARVYLDPHDNKSHLDTETPLVFPYWECGATGSTTSALPLKSASFRHTFVTITGTWTPGSSDAMSSSLSGDERSPPKYPLLLVALSPLVLELNSGESRNFPAGSVILLEDTMQPGYRLKPVQPTHTEVQALFLTLPQPYYKSGKQNLSLQSYLQSYSIPPCPPGTESDNTDKSVASNSQRSFRHASSTLSKCHADHGRKIRLTIWTVLGISLSTLLGDFLGKVAPLWLAVGIGGTCLVAAGTYSTIQLGEYLFTLFIVQQERRKIQQSRDTNSFQSNKENEQDESIESTISNKDETKSKPKEITKETVETDNL